MRRAGLLLGAAALAHAASEGAVRLIDPSDPEAKDAVPWGRKWWMGRTWPQIYYKGEWGAVCGGDSVSAPALEAMGKVVCREASGKDLKRVKQLPIEFFPMVTGGAGRIWLDAYQCPDGARGLGECIYALDAGAYTGKCRAIAVECGDADVAASGGAPPAVQRAKACPSVQRSSCPGFSNLGSCLDAPTSPAGSNKCKGNAMDALACGDIAVGSCYSTSPGRGASSPLYCESTLACERSGYGDLDVSGCERAQKWGTDKCALGGMTTFDARTPQEVLDDMDIGVLPSVGCSRMPRFLGLQRDVSTPIVVAPGGVYSQGANLLNAGGLGTAALAESATNRVGGLQVGSMAVGTPTRAAVGDVPGWHTKCGSDDLVWYVDPKGRGRPCGGTRVMCICSCNQYDELTSAAPACDEDGAVRIRSTHNALQICHQRKWGFVCGTGLFQRQTVDNQAPSFANNWDQRGFTRGNTGASPESHAVPIANIGCAQAKGLAPASITSTVAAPAGSTVWLDNLRCPADGSAKFISDCIFATGWGEYNTNGQTNCPMISLVCDEDRLPVPRPQGKPNLSVKPLVCSRVYPLSEAGRATPAGAAAPVFQPWNVRAVRNTNSVLLAGAQPAGTAANPAQAADVARWFTLAAGGGGACVSTQSVGTTNVKSCGCDCAAIAAPAVPLAFVGVFSTTADGEFVPATECGACVDGAVPAIGTATAANRYNCGAGNAQAPNEPAACLGDGVTCTSAAGDDCTPGAACATRGTYICSAAQCGATAFVECPAGGTSSAPTLAPTRSPFVGGTGMGGGRAGATRAPTQFPTSGLRTSAPTFGGARLRRHDPSGWSSLTGCPLYHVDPPPCLGATTGTTCMSVSGECGTKKGYCYRVGASPGEGAQFCEAKAPCASMGYADVESEAECESAKYSGTNRCFSDAGATFFSGAQVLGGIWSAAMSGDHVAQTQAVAGNQLHTSNQAVANLNPGASNTVFSNWRQDGQAFTGTAGFTNNQQVSIDNADATCTNNACNTAGACGTGPVCIRADNGNRCTCGLDCPAVAPPAAAIVSNCFHNTLATADGGLVRANRIFGLGLFPTGCFKTNSIGFRMGDATTGIHRNGWGNGQTAGADGAGTWGNGTLLTAFTGSMPSMADYCDAWNAYAWLADGAAGWDLGRECGLAGIPCVCKCTPPATEAPVPAATGAPATGAPLAKPAGKCAAWCRQGKHKAKAWAAKCGWDACSPCAECAPTPAPAPAPAGSCNSWCDGAKHESTPWSLKCTWDACSTCAACTPTAPPTPAPCMAFCSKHSDRPWAQKCAEWANCKGCAQCSRSLK